MSQAPFFSGEAALTVICAWCSKILRAGGARHSHGICEPCAAVHFPQAMAAQRADAGAEMAEVSQ